MERFDQIVVGGGIGGLTLAALLGASGRRVMLLEKGPRAGGSLLRFSRRGIPFDTGFHFSGGFAPGGVLTEMLRVLGIEGAIRPDPIRDPRDNRLVFESSGREFALPTRIGELAAALRGYFPAEASALGRYFDMVERVGENTVSMNLRTITEPSRPLPEDAVTLADALDGLTGCGELKAILAAYSTCYGVPADQVSCANHCRICHGLYRSAARVIGGGPAFLDALSGSLARHGVAVRTSDWIVECADIRDRRVGRLLLASGLEAAARDIIFTIHPRHILDTLPPDRVHKAFADRVLDFEPSVGFFCLYGVVRGDGIPPFDPALVSLFPVPEMRSILRAGPSGDRAAVILKHRETVGAGSVNVLTALEVSEPSDVAAWADSRTGRRPAAYAAYKRDRRERLERRVLRGFPEFAGRLEVLETASMLTFRDYLHSPWGCAYGVRQKIGQINLFGRLPFANLYAAGQSAALPGVVGSMLASFLVARALLGREEFGRFVARRLDGVPAGAPA